MKANLTKRKIATLAGLTFLMCGLCGCQSSNRKTFESIKVGMDKSTVVETMGGPTVSRRWKGKDRWIYRFRDGAPESHEVREVHFEEGRAVYVGNEVVPTVSADEQDRLNETLVAEDLRRMKEDAERRAEHLGIISDSTDTATAEPTFTEDPLDRRLRESMYGIPSSPETESRKRPPTFVPIQ